MKQLLREPLLHFILLGAVLFAVVSVVRRPDQPQADRIVVSAGKIEHLAALFARTWQRPPTRKELDGLIEDYVREEAAYRAGTAAGLDRDDTVIRRRIRQKLEFVAEDLAAQASPSDEELAAYLAAHPEAFRVDPRLSFRQVYLDPARHRDSLEQDALQVLAALKEDPSLDASALGDRIMLEHAYRDLSANQIDSLFGGTFADRLLELQPGSWQGPIASGYGLHLVFVDDRTEGRVADLSEVRDQVRREWENARRLEALDAFYQGLIDRYEVVVEWPDLGGERGPQ
ncbi:MAG: peptidyl-prolyl cis-trans isomerase [Phycisphaerales bacterium]|nr:peptidyl-prolyl cis-trans isomerase [Phycisphaerales bacterium]